MHSISTLPYGASLPKDHLLYIYNLGLEWEHKLSAFIQTYSQALLVYRAIISFFAAAGSSDQQLIKDDE
ncbi:MAG: hypothetical protein ABIO01_06485 [Ferruginibacter sp.]